MAALSFSLFLCLVLGTVLADEHIKTESDLRKDLFLNYDKLVRPVRRNEDVVPVKVAITPQRVQEVDVKEKTVKLDTWLYVRWNDSFLSWDPSEYGGIDEISIPATEIWTPDIGLLTASPDSSVFPTVHSKVIIMHMGTLLWTPPYTFKSGCPPSEGQVTADTFQCTLTFGSWTSDAKRVHVQELEPNPMQGMTRKFYKDTNEKWTLESIAASSEQSLLPCCPERYSLVKFDLLFRKKPQSED